jgi:hypothetical protein
MYSHFAPVPGIPLIRERGLEDKPSSGPFLFLHVPLNYIDVKYFAI